MSVAFRAAGPIGFTANGQPGTTVSTTAPSGVLGGDWLFTAVSSIRGGTSSTALTSAEHTLSGTGWTLVTDFSSSGSTSFGPWVSLWRKAAAGTSGQASSDAGATVTASFPTSSRAAIAVVAYSGAAFLDQAAIGVLVGGNSYAAPQVTTTRTSEQVVEFWLSLNSSATPTSFATVPATSRLNGTASNGLPIAIADQAQSAAGQSTTQTASSSSSMGQVAAFTMALAVNAPPNAPTPTPLANNGNFDRTQTQRFPWTFSDPDTNDSQSAWDFFYSYDNGATWTTISSGASNGTNQYVDVPGGTFTNGSLFQYQIRTYDSQGAVGPRSASAYATGYTPPPAPTVTPANGATVDQNVTATIADTDSACDGYSLVGYPDNGSGQANTGAQPIYTQNGTSQGSPPYTVPVSGLPNNTTVHARVFVTKKGLQSAVTDVAWNVAYAQPPAAVGTLSTVTVVAEHGPSQFQLAWTTPAATGSQPAATAVTVQMSFNGGTTWVTTTGPRALAASWLFATPASGVNYQFRLITWAANGTMTIGPVIS